MRVRQFAWRTHEAWLTWPRRGQQDQHEDAWTTGPTCNGVAPVNLTDRCWPMGIRMVQHILDRVADHDEAAKRPLRYNFSKVVLADHRQAQTDHQ